MLFGPPPGYNAASVNSQNISPMNTPGQQGQTAQGYLNNQFKSSYAAPSNYSVPSSVPYPQANYGPPMATASMARALRGA